MKKYFKANLNELIQSFKLGKDFFYYIFSDMLFWLASLLSGACILLYFNKLSVQSNIYNTFVTMAGQSNVDVSILDSEARSFLVIFIFLIILLALIVLASFNLSRSLIYTRLMKSNITWNYFFRFAGLNFMLGVFSYLVLIFFRQIKLALPVVDYLFLPTLFIIAYFSVLSAIIFTKSKKIFSSIAQAITKGIEHLPNLFFSGIAIIIVFLAIRQLNTLIFLLNPVIATVISIIFFILFVSWARLYFVKQASKLL
jgi:hypothetical protein